jgi:hypothetical protein
MRRADIYFQDLKIAETIRLEKEASEKKPEKV